MKDTLIAVIQNYIDGVISLEKFENWYVPKLESLIDDAKTGNIVAQIELGLAELQNGFITEDDLKNDLKDILRRKNGS